MATVTLNLRLTDSLGVAGGCPVQTGERVATWIARTPSKVLARALGAEVRTVEAWKSGRAPNQTHFWAMVEAWGQPFLEFVFEPVLAESDQLLERQLDRIQADIAVLRERLADGERLARGPDGAAAQTGGGFFSGAGPEARKRRAAMVPAKSGLGSILTATALILATLALPLQPDDMPELRQVRPAKPAAARVFHSRTRD